MTDHHFTAELWVHEEVRHGVPGGTRSTVGVTVPRAPGN